MDSVCVPYFPTKYHTMFWHPTPPGMPAVHPRLSKAPPMVPAGAVHLHSLMPPRHCSDGSSPRLAPPRPIVILIGSRRLTGLPLKPCLTTRQSATHEFLSSLHSRLQSSLSGILRLPRTMSAINGLCKVANQGHSKPLWSPPDLPAGTRTALSGSAIQPHHACHGRHAICRISCRQLPSLIGLLAGPLAWKWTLLH
jgi:hypothetical protein